MPPCSESFPNADALMAPERVRQLFSQPSRLADSAFLRREVADRMHERLQMIRAEPARILDAGCGEGADLPLLRQRFPGAQILGLDGSFPMLEKAGQEAAVICGDFGAVPLASGSCGMLWSNLALYWHPRVERVFSEWRRVLAPDALLMFSSFGPGTLGILREAFAKADHYPHVLPFMEMHDLGDRLVDAGFLSPVLDREVITVTYSSVKKLFSDVRAFGGNALSGRRRGLPGKKAWASVPDFLESERDADGRIPVDFEIIYGHAFCTAEMHEGRGEMPLRFYR